MTIIMRRGYRVCESSSTSSSFSPGGLTILLWRTLDLRGLDELEFEFDIGKPFRPFEQLMGVLPEASKELIPPAYRVRIRFYCACSLGCLGINIHFLSSVRN
jgi:hypothetical protein